MLSTLENNNDDVGSEGFEAFFDRARILADVCAGVLQQLASGILNSLSARCLLPEDTNFADFRTFSADIFCISSI